MTLGQVHQPIGHIINELIHVQARGSTVQHIFIALSKNSPWATAAFYFLRHYFR